MNIVVGMSGGVDSSVAAFQLLQAGHRVSGLFMKNWEEDDRREYCAAAADLADAQEVCRQLEIPLRTINFSHEYWTRVFEIFLAEYQRGRTPNPDVLCNKEIKFKEFLEFALHLGADAIATGHYARRETRGAHHAMCRGRDRGKDQSYFLHTLDQNALQHSRFPIGGMKKTEVRETARQQGFVTHDKKDSTGICFIGERRFDDFLKRYLPSQPGNIKTQDGETIGSHHGACYHTIGQRRGLGIGGDGAAWYVAGKDIARNEVYVVQGHDHPALEKSTALTEALHWVAGAAPPLPLTCTAQTRYRQQDAACVVSADGGGARVSFTKPQWAMTPGQSVVLYDREECLGGGVIVGVE